MWEPPVKTCLKTTISCHFLCSAADGCSAELLSPLQVCVDSVKCVAVAVRVLELHPAGEA